VAAAAVIESRLTASSGDNAPKGRYYSKSMTLVDRIIDGVKDLSQRDQVKVMNLVFSLNPRMQREQGEMLRSLHGVLSEEDGEAFQSAMEGSRRMPGNG